MNQRTCRSILSALFVSFLSLTLLSQAPEMNPASSEKLGGTNRYLTHLSTDKPIYRGGETVHIRGPILNAKNNTPLPSDEHIRARMKVTGPKGNTVHQRSYQVKHSTVGAKWEIPAEQSGGIYECTVRFTNKPYPPATRSFEVRAYRTPRLKSQIEFLRDGYGPGDTVTATISVERAEGGIPEQATVTVIARAGGQEIHRHETELDDSGHASAQFDLPESLDSTQGTLSFVVEDGGVKETKSRSIPILLNNLNLSLYPEGGDLIAHLPNRVYFEARTPDGKPVNIQGKLVNDKQQTVAKFEGVHEGRGHFSFTPDPDRSYRVTISKPSGISKTFSLPEVRQTGAVLQSTSNVTPADEPVHLKVGSPVSQTVQVIMRKREETVAKKTVDLDAKKLTDVTLSPEKHGEGVLVVTVTNERNRPVAERLVFRKPDRDFNISLSMQQQQYTPGSEVKLTVKTTDEDGDPVPAVVGLTATDESVLEMKKQRDQAPRLRSMVYLESETDQLKDARVYLDPTNDQAPEALDLLLGTQGWRRFALYSVDSFLKQYEQDARRVLAYHEEKPPKKVKIGTDRRRVALAEVEQKDVQQNQEDNQEVEADFAAQNRKGEFEAPPARRENKAKRYVEHYRVYAHSNDGTDRRNDFTETVFWHAGVNTGTNGTKTVSFDLSDSITSFQIRAGGFTRHGEIAEATKTVESVKPLYVEPKLPLHVTGGDSVQVPVSVVHNGKKALKDVTLTASSGNKLNIKSSDHEQTFDLQPDERTRRWIMMQVRNHSGEQPLTLTIDGGQYNDEVSRSIKIESKGFPFDESLNGVIEENSRVSHTFQLPSSFVDGSVEARVNVYPSPLANLQDAMTSLIKRPTGCFEQASSSNYPMVMAQQYFQRHPDIDPALVAKSKKMLDQGYKKLVSYETERNGYEWFGKTPPHEALTAYGLLEFSDMKEVYSVDADMIERTRNWLMDRRTGDGTFRLNDKAIDSFGRAPENVTNPYIVWALLESGETGLDREIEHVRQLARNTDDPYIVSLAANSLWIYGDQEAARSMMKKLKKQQTQDGYVEGAKTSITQSGGRSLKIETTALSVLAWLRADNSFQSSVESGIQWILKQNSGGQFGSTQSTVLALKAIVAYDRANAKPDRPGELQLFLDGEPVGEPVTFTKKKKGTISLPSFAEELSGGEHTLSMKMKNGSSMPYSVNLTYNTPKPISSSRSSTEIDVSLSEENVSEGDVLEADVKVRNRSDEQVNMPVAIVGLPGGLEPRHERFKELVKSGKIAAYELMGRDLVLYWRSLDAQEEISLSVDLKAAIPGKYTGPASRSYPYYHDEQKQWHDPLSIHIQR